MVPNLHRALKMRRKVHHNARSSSQPHRASDDWQFSIQSHQPLRAAQKSGYCPASLALMKTGLAAYQALVDALVARRECVLSRRVGAGQLWPEHSHLAQFNELLVALTPDQRAGVASLLAKAREGGMHDTLVELSERSNLQGLRLAQGGVELPHEPYGTEIYFDWVARCAGEEWPDEG
jgi:hypothetical protein